MSSSCPICSGVPKATPTFGPRVSIAEDFADGVAPGFQAEGFARPERVALVRDGELVGALTSPRTAREFALEANGANADEMPEAIAMEAGDLPRADALAAAVGAPKAARIASICPNRCSAASMSTILRAA